LTTHDDPEDGANDNELNERVSETGEDLNNGEREQVDSERNPPAIAVGNQPEDKRPDRTQCQSCRKRQRYRLIVFREAMTDGREAEDYKEEVEPIECPARECTQERA
jgi:hypothetical protein